MDISAWHAWRGHGDHLAMSAYASIQPPADSSAGTRLHFLREIDSLDARGVSPLPQDLPPKVRHLFESTQIPDWLRQYGDVERATANACQIFHDDIVAFVIALLCKSLPECYAGRRGAAVLAYTGALGDPNYANPIVQDTLVRRVVETAVFVRNVHRDSLWKGADPVAIRTIHKVRLFHCGIRTMIEQRNARGVQAWDFDDLGVPINQQDMVATNLAFALQSMKGAAALGVRLSTRDRADILLHWARIGYHLGIEEQLLREFLERPDELWGLVVKEEMRSSEQGHALTAAMNSFLHAKLFHAFHNTHLPEFFMTKLMDSAAQEAVDLRSLPKPNGSATAILLSTFFRVVHRVLLSVPIVGKMLLNFIGSEIVDVTVAAWAGKRNPHITLSRELEGV